MMKIDFTFWIVILIGYGMIASVLGFGWALLLTIIISIPSYLFGMYIGKRR